MQVHGHDFYSVASLPDKFPQCFVSCSEEKVIRVFEAPTNFYQYLSANSISTLVPDASTEKVASCHASVVS